MTNLLNSGKGQAQNYFAVIVFLFSFSIITIFAYLILSGITAEWASLPMYDANIAAASANFLGGIAILDYVTVFLMMILIIGLGATTYALPSKTIGFILTWAFGAMYGFVSYFFNYLFAQIVSQPVFLTVITVFPKSILICTNLHWIMLVMIVMGSITLYAKKERGLEGSVEGL